MPLSAACLPRARELGIYVRGSRGQNARQTPDELRAVADVAGLNGQSLVHTRLAHRARRQERNHRQMDR